MTDSKLAAVRAVLRAARRPLTLQELQPLVEERLKQIVGRGRLYNILAMAAGAGEIKVAGRAATRTYALGRGR